MAEILKTKWGFTGKEWSYTADDPRVIEEMYGYHPEEARKILAEAGYPNGFETSILLPPEEVDFYSLIAGYLKTNLNINLKLDVRERTVYTSIRDSRQFPALLELGFGHLDWPERWIAYGPPDPALPRNVSNRAEITDPVIMDAIRRADAAWNAGDIALRTKVMQEVLPYIVQTAWYGTFPAPHTYNVYQPWLKNNYGVRSAGNRSYYNVFKYAWVDQELKKQMGFK
ncbi:MAG: hypothetical protein Q8P60_06900 [Pseudorhodobacter sp.]|nr:hypothetical protein [Pseudorhodobacter sp.]